MGRLLRCKSVREGWGRVASVILGDGGPEWSVLVAFTGVCEGMMCERMACNVIESVHGATIRDWPVLSSRESLCNAHLKSLDTRRCKHRFSMIPASTHVPSYPFVRHSLQSGPILTYVKMLRLRQIKSSVMKNEAGVSQSFLSGMKEAVFYLGLAFEASSTVPACSLCSCISCIDILLLHVGC